MQIDRVRHHGGADDADGEQQRAGIGDLRHHGVDRRRRPIDRRDEHLDQVAEPDEADHAADDQLDRPESETFEHQDAVGGDRGDHHPGEERHPEQQREPDGAAEKLGQVGRHGGDLAHPPHAEHHRLRKLLAAQFGQVASGDDAELGGERLEQHGDEVGGQHHPEQLVAVAGAGLDVGREISRIDIGDRGDHRRARRRRAARPARRAGRPAPRGSPARCARSGSRAATAPLLSRPASARPVRSSPP